MWFINKIKDIYGTDNKEYINNGYDNKTERNIYVTDKRKIDNLIEYLNNKDRKSNIRCFS